MIRWDITMKKWLGKMIQKKVISELNCMIFIDWEYNLLTNMSIKWLIVSWQLFFTYSPKVHDLRTESWIFLQWNSQELIIWYINVKWATLSGGQPFKPGGTLGQLTIPIEQVRPNKNGLDHYLNFIEKNVYRAVSMCNTFFTKTISIFTASFKRLAVTVYFTR